MAGMLEFRCDLGDGLELRPAAVAHTHALFAAVDGDRAALGRWLPWVKDVTAPVHSGTFLRDAVLLSADLKAFYVSLWAEDRLVGMASLDPIALPHRASLGWWLVSAVQGRGYATRAAAALRDEAFGRWNLAEVEAFMARENEASRAVAERIGLVSDGALGQSTDRPHQERYSMTREVWGASYAP